MTQKETRFIPVEQFEVRVAKDGDGKTTIIGHAAVYDQWSPVYGDFRERIAPGFFDAALSREDADIRALFNHSPDYVLGRTKSNTLKLSNDEVGLRMEIAVPDTTFARDLLVSMERGDITGASFSFTLPDKDGDTWSKGEDGVMERTLVKADKLYDVGPVTMPWYPQTDVNVTAAKRSLDAWEAEHAPVEEEKKAEPEVAEARGRLIEGNNDSDLRDRLRLALAAAEPTAEYLWVEAVFDAEVVYEMRFEGGPYALYSRSFQAGADGDVEIGAERVEVRRRVSYEVVEEEGLRSAPPLALLKVMQEQKEREAAS